MGRIVAGVGETQQVHVEPVKRIICGTRIPPKLQAKTRHFTIIFLLKKY
jgi:hypothetical protein